MYDTILLPTDGSEASLRAADEAFDLARELDATVHVVFVVDESISSLLLSGDTMSEVLEELTQQGEEAVAEVAARGEGVETVESVIRDVDVEEALIEYVEEHDVDAVVMATHGRHGVEHLLGSTTERVIRGAGVPVLVVGGET